MSKPLGPISWTEKFGIEITGGLKGNMPLVMQGYAKYYHQNMMEDVSEQHNKAMEIAVKDAVEATIECNIK
jgi:hypothetical protein